MESKDSFKEVQAKDLQRPSSFADLDRSIRAAYKILSEIRVQLETHASRDQKVWQLLVRWISFAPWFSYEKDPVLETLLGEPLGSIMDQIK